MSIAAICRATRASGDGRWQVFEFALANHPHLPANFCRALDRDLPRRRRKIFKIAYELGDVKLMEEVWSKLGPRDLTPAIVFKKFAATVSGAAVLHWWRRRVRFFLRATP